MKGLLSCALMLLSQGCALVNSTSSPEKFQTRGTASWYGQEFAGRTTANGEIFDPFLLTAAHRTLPFGTVVSVKNIKSGASVEVRINDRGPFVGDRLIDLSYSAAEKIGLIDQGIGEVDLTVVKIGRGDREAPAPYVIKIPRPAEIIRDPSAPPPVAFPLPEASGTTSVPATSDFGVGVVEESAGTPVRKQVSASGTTLEDVPVPGGVPQIPSIAPVRPPAPPVPAISRPRPTGGFVVQAGAFQIEQNARALRERVAAILPGTYVDQDQNLFRVRVGPFKSRSEAVDARARLEGAGLSGIILAAQ